MTAQHRSKATAGTSRRTVLIISQIFEPDPAAVGQYLASAARVLARHGRRIVVYTARRGYDDPTRVYPRRELHAAGVEVRRLPWSSFGKTSLARRVAAQLIFLVQATGRGLTCRDLHSVLVSTNPPMSAAAALVVGFVRRVPITYWVMDINPDQAVATGQLRAGSPLVRALDWLNRRALRRARAVVTLDRHMAARLAAKADIGGKVAIIPPWPLSDDLATVAPHENPFVARWGLAGKRVVMYSGNHSPSHPLTTLLDAAGRLRERHELVFMFVGGGLGKGEVERAIAASRLPNVRSLPYQPIGEIKHSLAAADVHVVSIGDDTVGIVHPSKPYNALALGKPLLVLGPDDGVLSELVSRHGIGWQVAHGDVDGAVEVLASIAAMSRAELDGYGTRAAQVARERFSTEELTRRFCAAVDGHLADRR